MGRVEKTVFVSYRRTNIPWALAIFQNLDNHGYDVFVDYTGIASGDFEQVILGNTISRAHFLVILTPSALERCDYPADLLRREIETALDSKRNIVPLMLEGFDFGSPGIAGQFPGKLEALRRYNGLSIPPEYFLEAMDKLRGRYLNVPLDSVLHPASPSAQLAATQQKVAAETAPAVQTEQLTAQQWLERGLSATNIDERVRLFNEAIRLSPENPIAFLNRGAARANGEISAALLDFEEAIRLSPADDTLVTPIAFSNRGHARLTKGDVDGALQDFDDAIRLKPDLAEAYHNRGHVREQQGDTERALQDYDEAIRLKPSSTDALMNRAYARNAKGDVEGALRDLNEVI